MPDVSTKSRFTFEGLKPEDFSVDPTGKITIDNKALGDALKQKLQGATPVGGGDKVFPDGSESADFVRVAVDVG